MTTAYYATQLNGDGTETLLGEVPLQGAVFSEVLSGPGGVKASLTPELAALKGADGKPLFRRWGTAVYEEIDGVLRRGAIVTTNTDASPDLQVAGLGFTAYPKKLPWVGKDVEFIGADPLDIVRHIWAHVQGHRGGNLGVVVEGTRSPRRIGKKATTTSFTTGAGQQVDFEKGPYRLASYQTFDLGKNIDDLAVETPFEYRMVHAWDTSDPAHRRIKHTLKIGYPRLGNRMHHLRFAVGENVFTPPPLEYPEADYADEVIVLGAGEGRDMIRSLPAVRKRPGQLRRVAVVEDPDMRSNAAANRRAETVMAALSGEGRLDTLVVTPTPSAMPGDYNVGDEIYVTLAPGWTERHGAWVRIISIEGNTDGTETLGVIDADRLTL